MKKKILIVLLSFLFLSTAFFSGVFLSLNFPQSETAGGGQEIIIGDGTNAASEVPLNTDGTWLSEGDRFATSFAGGSGTENDPYEIETAEQLAFLSYVVRYANSFYADLYYEQTADIDVSTYYWYPIGSISSTYAFKGHYNGNGFTISGVYTQSAENYQGLFGYINGTSSNRAEISNIGIVNSNIQGDLYVGGIAGYAFYTTINNCYNMSDVTSKTSSSTSYVGGIAGDSYTSTITNSYNTGNVTGSGYIGGIVGFSSYTSNLSVSYNTGEISGTSYIGGIAGYSTYSSSLSNVYNLGNIKSENAYVGGVVGYNTYSARVNNSYNIGNINGRNQVGGIAGYNNNGSYVYSSFNLGGITAYLYMGGIVGQNASGSIYNCYYGGDCSSSVGGINGSNISGQATYLSTIVSNAKNQSWFTATTNWYSAYPWNFTSVWMLVDGHNEGYPVLQDVERFPDDLTESWTDSGNYATSFAGGSGTSTSPWRISTASQLARMAYLVNNSNSSYGGDYYILTADVDMSSYYWVPIGTSSSAFSGHFDGQGFTISGVFNEYSSTSQHQGFFGYVKGTTSAFASIEDIVLKDSYIIGRQDSGSIIGWMQYANVKNLYNYANVTGLYQSIGGIAGCSTNCKIINCHNYGVVTNENTSGTGYTGGIAGYVNTSSLILRCSNSGNVISTTNNVSGGAGYLTGSSKMQETQNYGKIEGGSGVDVGGLAGATASTAVVENCYNSGDISGSTYVGGFVGRNIGTVRDCQNDGNVMNLEISSTSYIGGIVGYNENLVDRCSNSGMVYGYGVSFTGGIAGSNYDADSVISNCYNTGDVTADEITGGIVGQMYSNGCVVRNCYNSGTVTGGGTYGGAYTYPNAVGGIAGYMNACDVLNCFNVGSVVNTRISDTGYQYEGGAIVGQIFNPTGGTNSRPVNIHAYYGGDSSSLDGVAAQNNQGGGTIKTNLLSTITTSAKTKSWYTTTSNWNSSYAWDFTDSWILYPNENDGYPVLRKFAKTIDSVSELWTASGNYATSFAGGSGTSTSPWQISTPQQLARVAYLVNNSNSTYGDDYYVMTADVDISEYEWEPIGTSSSIDFAGHFDGDNYEISGLNLLDDTASIYGLFGYATGAVIENVIIKSGVICGTRTTGAILGQGSGVTIQNCVNHADFTQTSCQNLGGIAGMVGNTSRVIGCINYGTIYGRWTGAGIVGWVSSAGPTFENCVNYGDVTCENGGNTGGIVGGGYTTSITNCVNYGKIWGASNNRNGGITGGNYDNGQVLTISDCTNYGDVVGSQYTGGIVGYFQNANSRINNCANYGGIMGISSYTGGIVGYAVNVQVRNSYNTGNVQGTSYVGGILGRSQGATSSYTNVANCYNTGSINGSSSYVGGIIGYQYQYGRIYNCFNTGAVSGSSYAYGLAGRGGTGSYVYYSYWGGNCTATTGVSGGTTSSVSRDTSIISNAKNKSWYSGTRWNASYSWDFDNVWGLNSSINDGYPIFTEYGTLTYNLNGGVLNETTGSVTVDYDRYNTITLPTPTRDGYTFEDWVVQTSSNNWVGNLTYVDGLSITGLHGDVTLQAQWSPTRYTITFNPSGGSVNGSTGTTYRYYDIEANTGSNYITSLPTPTRDGYTFDGWQPSASTGNWSSGTSYEAGANVEGMFGDVTLVAQWIAIDYTITFDLNGGSSTVGTLLDYDIEENVNLGLQFNEVNITKGGVTLVGWQPERAVGNWDTDTIYSLDTTYTNMWGNVTLVAVWEVNNPAYYDEDGDYYYVEIGKMPQTKVTDEKVLASLNGVTYSPDFDDQNNPDYSTYSWADTGNHANSFNYGSGTESDPYQIATPDQLAFLMYAVNNNMSNSQGVSYADCCYIQTADLDLSAYYWVPIGIYNGHNGLRFEGKYDGDGYVISGMIVDESINIYDPENTALGLFSIVSGAEILNVHIINSHVRTSGSLYVGGVAGYVRNSRLLNCSFMESDITIEDVTMQGNTVSGSVGGLVGYFEDGEMDNCYCNFEIMVGVRLTSSYGSQFVVGGLVGTAEHVRFSLCSNQNENEMRLDNYQFVTYAVGGIAGMTLANTRLTYCYNEVRGIRAISTAIGGLVGVFSEELRILDSYNCSEVTFNGNTTDASVGGLVGLNSSTSCRIIIERSYNIGVINRESIEGSGGLIGKLQVGRNTEIEIEASFNLGRVYENSASGGIIGVLDGIEVSQVVNMLNSCYYGGQCENIGAVMGTNIASVQYSSTLDTDIKSQSWLENLNFNMNYWMIDAEYNNGYPSIIEFPIYKLSSSDKSYQINGVILNSYYLEQLYENNSYDVIPNAEYVQWNGNWYKVEPIRWRLMKNSSQTEGFVTTDDTLAVMDKIVYLGQFANKELEIGEGYLNSNISNEFLNSGSGLLYNGIEYNKFLASFSADIEVFESNGIQSSIENDYIFVTSSQELESICDDDLSVEFSDLVMDMLIENNQLMLYYTRNLGDNVDNIICMNRVGDHTQRNPLEILGVRFTISITEYGCVS